MRKLVFALTLCASSALAMLVAAPAQADARSAVAEQIENVRKGLATDDTALAAEPPDQVLTELRRYMNDPDDRVRLSIVPLTGIVRRAHPMRSVRQQAARLILDLAVSDPDAGNRAYAAGRLKGYPRDDFTNEMKGIIHRVVVHSKSPGWFVAVAGVAEVRSTAPRLRELAQGGNWWAHLALARMGDPTAIAHVISTVENAKDQIQRLILLEHVTFIRQPQAVEVLVRRLFSEERTQGDGDVPSTSYASRAVNYLEEIIEGFPELEGGHEKRVAQARQWIAAQMKTGQDATSQQAMQQAIRQGGLSSLKIKR